MEKIPLFKVKCLACFQKYWQEKEYPIKCGQCGSNDIMVRIQHKDFNKNVVTCIASLVMLHSSRN